MTQRKMRPIDQWLPGPRDRRKLVIKGHHGTFWDDGNMLYLCNMMVRTIVICGIMQFSQ